VDIDFIFKHFLEPSGLSGRAIQRKSTLVTRCFSLSRLFGSQCETVVTEALRFGSNHGYQSLVILLFEFNNTISYREKRVVYTAAYVGARVEFGASLANEYVASDNFLSTITFDSKSIRVRVSSVFSGAHPFFVGKSFKVHPVHGNPPVFR